MKGYIRKSLAVLTALLIAVLNIVPASAEDNGFSDYLYDEWKDTVESDYLTMHSSVYDWRSLGLTKPEVTFGNIDEEEFKETVSYAEEALEKLAEINENLESYEISLEDSIKLFKEGLERSKLCQKKLDEAKLEIEKIEID
jgi:exodeoxyribonuclease VII small subunit